MTKILGHEFKPFDDNDWECFAGSEKGSLICCLGDLVLIATPDGSGGFKEIAQITDDGTEVVWTMSLR